jgi:hypothetical protein
MFASSSSYALTINVFFVFLCIFSFHNFKIVAFPFILLISAISSVQFRKSYNFTIYLK